MPFSAEGIGFWAKPAAASIMVAATVNNNVIFVLLIDFSPVPNETLNERFSKRRLFLLAWRPGRRLLY